MVVGLEVVSVVVVCAFCLLALLLPPTGMRRKVELACALGRVCQNFVMKRLVKRERGGRGGFQKGARLTPELKSRDVPRTQMTTRAAPARTTSLKPRVRATLRPYSSKPTILSCVLSYHVVLGWVMNWKPWTVVLEHVAWGLQRGKVCGGV